MEIGWIPSISLKNVAKRKLKDTDMLIETFLLPLNYLLLSRFLVLFTRRQLTFFAKLLSCLSRDQQTMARHRFHKFVNGQAKQAKMRLREKQIPIIWISLKRYWLSYSHYQCHNQHGNVFLPRCMSCFSVRSNLFLSSSVPTDRTLGRQTDSSRDEPARVFSCKKDFILIVNIFFCCRDMLKKLSIFSQWIFYPLWCRGLAKGWRNN